MRIVRSCLFVVALLGCLVTLGLKKGDAPGKNVQTFAESFLGSLDDEQKARTVYDIEDEAWRKWCNVDNGIYKRDGVSLEEMSEAQRDAAWSLLDASLSAQGVQLSKDIMKTDHTLWELNDQDPIFSEDLYFLTVFGTPSESEPWGWQLDGQALHH